MAYFKKRSISAVTVANLSSRSGEHTIHISASIIDIIIMKLFLEGGASGATKARVKGLFSPVIDDGSSAFMPSYTVTIANITDFKTSLLGASLGMTFRATAKFANGQSTIQGRRGCYHLSPGTVTKYVRTTVAVVMEVIWSLLANPSVWAFSLAFDSTTHDGHSYFDVRIRLQIAGRLLNIRVAALPVYGSHKANDFMPILTSLLGALCPDWKEKLIGISTDGKRSMVGHKGGIVTQLIRLAAPQIVYRVWCLIHQLDIFAKRALDELYDGCFVKLMNKLTHDLRKNLTFISGPSDDGTRNGLCLMQSTRWLAMGKRCKWLLGHRYTIIDFIALQTRAGAKTAVDLPEWFWPIVGVVNSYIRGFELALKQLQEANIVLSQQDLIVVELTERLQCNTHAMKTTDTAAIVDCADDDNGIDWNDISGDSNSTRVDDGNGNSIGSGDRDVVSSGTWSVSINHVAQYIRDCGSSINADFDRLSALHRDRLIRQTGRFITSILTGVSGVCALRDPNNEMSREQLPPIFPRQLVKMSGVEFATKYKPFLKRFGDLRGKDMAGQAELAHAEMVAAFKERGLAQTVISLQTDKTPFNKAWEQLGCDYPLLCDFVGGIATIFANSGTVESDFSKLNRIANPHRRSLTDLSLEGSLQAKYYEEMFKLGGIVL
ncbi:hypothetical protein GGI13_000635 [Coemansia sp. RSA 455]|nr:hypothetical protein GGI13_000635 [Coemansia sp. RSA 455]